MPATAIVPKGDGVLAPAESAGKTLVARMLKQEIQERFALAFSHPGEAQGEGRIHIEAFSPCLGMRADDRVFVFRRINRDLGLHRLAILRRLPTRAIFATRRVNGIQATQHLFHAI